MQDEITIAYSRNKEVLYRIQEQLLEAEIHSFVETSFQMVLGQENRYYLKCHIDSLQAVREFLWAREERGEMDIEENDISWDDLLKEAHQLNEQQEASSLRGGLLFLIAVGIGLAILYFTM